MSDIFISYAREDLEAARRLAAALEEQGWSAFWDRTIPAGRSWREVIGAALADARCIVVLWSRHSVTSNWVLEEADHGLRRRILIPAFIEPIEPPLGFGSIQAADLSEWDGHARDVTIQRFFVDVAGVLGPAPGMPTKQRGRTEAKASQRAEQQRRQQAEAEAKRHDVRTRMLEEDEPQLFRESSEGTDAQRIAEEPTWRKNVHRGTALIFNDTQRFPVALATASAGYVAFTLLLLGGAPPDQEAGALLLINCAVLGLGMIFIAFQKLKPSHLSGAAAITQCIITVAMLLRDIGDPEAVLTLNGFLVAAFVVIGWLYRSLRKSANP